MCGYITGEPGGAFLKTAMQDLVLGLEVAVESPSRYGAGISYLLDRYDVVLFGF